MLQSYEAIYDHGIMKWLGDQPSDIRARVSHQRRTHHTIMNDTLWIGVYPGLTEEMLGFVCEKIEAFFGVNF